MIQPAKSSVGPTFCPPDFLLHDRLLKEILSNICTRLGQQHSALAKDLGLYFGANKSFLLVGQGTIR